MEKQPPKKRISDALAATMDDVHPIERSVALQEGREPRTNIEALVHRMWTKALAGDPRAMGMILERIEGKAEGTVNVNTTITNVADEQKAITLAAIVDKLAALREQKAQALGAVVDVEVIRESE